MSIGAASWVLKQDLKPVDKIILLVIADTADGYSGELAAPLGEIAKASRVSVSTAYRSIEILEGLGFISKVAELSGNLRTHNRYVIGKSFGRVESLFSLGQFDRPAAGPEPAFYADQRSSSLGQFDRVDMSLSQSSHKQQPVVAAVICEGEVSNARRKKRAYLDENPPLLEDWVAYAASDEKINWFPKDEIENAYDWYVAHGWCQKDGTRLQDWKSLVRRWARSWKKDNGRLYMDAVRRLQTQSRPAILSAPRSSDAGW